MPGARAAFEEAVAIDPQCAHAHRGLAPIYHLAGDAAAAERSWRAGFPEGALVMSEFRGPGEAVRVLLLMSTLGGNVPLQYVLDDRVFQWTELFVEAHAEDAPLPPHAVAFSAIGDADRCAAALAA